MAGGQRRLESQYAEHEGKYLMALVIGTPIILGLFMFLLFGVRWSHETRKIRQDPRRSERVCACRRDYRKEHGALPESFAELRAFAIEKEEYDVFAMTFEEITTLIKEDAVTGEGFSAPIDPWKREYRYFKVSDDRAAVVSGGRNRKIETSLDYLSAASSDATYKTKKKNVFSLAPEEDDWIYVVGAWRTEEE